MSAVFAEGGFKKMGFMRKLNGPPSEQRVPQEGPDAEQDIRVTGHGFNPWTDPYYLCHCQGPGITCSVQSLEWLSNRTCI